MRVAFVNNFAYVTGGADVHCFDLADILHEHGHEARFLATAAPDQVVSAGAFVPLHVTNATRDHVSPATRARVASQALWNRAARSAMSKLIQDFRPDVVHVHKAYPHLSVAPILTAAQARIPIVQTVHDYEFVSANAFDASGAAIDRKESQAQYRALNTLLFQVKRRFHVPAVNSWIAVSRSTASFYERAGIHATVLPNFTRVPVLPEAPPGERSGLLYIGRLAEDKGIRDVVSVARAMSDVPVRVAGYGALESYFREAASELPNLEYLGSLPQREVHNALVRSRVCLMPSHWQEPGPLACLEAMAAGTPVVAYANGGLAEYVADAGGGLVVEEQVEALTQACIRLVSDDTAWQESSNNALRASRETHSADAYYQRLLQVYTDAIVVR